MQLTNILSSTGLMVLLGATQVAALNPDCAPGGNFDLSKWKLQLPVGSPGRPTTISSGQLQGCQGYSNSQYFYTDKSDGALVFKVAGGPANTGCVTTPNSKHCRSELRESNPSKWSPKGNQNRLFGDLKVTKNGGETCIGQIHIDDSISTKPVAELYYNSKGALKMGVQKCRTCSQQRFDIDNVPIGQRFTYEIRYEQGKLSVSINGKSFQGLTTFDLNSPTSYFKAGNYNQGTSAVEVHYYQIRTTHN